MCVTIDDIANRHKEWKKIAVYCGCPLDLVDDIVQDMYYKLCKIAADEGGLCRITYNGNVNMVYMFSMISNAITSEHRKKKPVDFIENVHDMVNAEVFIEKPYHDLIDAIHQTLNKMHWYDRQLFMLYVNSGKSMRKISAETGISLTSINNTIQNVKRTIKETHESDYEKAKETCFKTKE